VCVCIYVYAFVIYLQETDPMSRFDLSEHQNIKIATKVTKPKEIYLRYFPNHQIDADNSDDVDTGNPGFSFIVTIKSIYIVHLC